MSETAGDGAGQPAAARRRIVLCGRPGWAREAEGLVDEVVVHVAEVGHLDLGAGPGDEFDDEGPGGWLDDLSVRLEAADRVHWTAHGAAVVRDVPVIRLSWLARSAGDGSEPVRGPALDPDQALELAALLAEAARRCRQARVADEHGGPELPG
jgi:hypothetical protein